MRRPRKENFKKVQEAFIRSMSKSQSFNSDLDIDLEDAFSLSSEIERATILLNRLVMTDIDLKSE
jgi:uncharacterized protein (UPF0303 family)